MTDSRTLALVTGASSGIGFELARLCVENGFELVVTAEDAGLERAAEELRAGGGTVQSVRADLATDAGVEELAAALAALDRPVAVAALNAGVGQAGAFIETDLADLRQVIDLNVTSTVSLARLLLPPMVAAGAGKVLITSSIASTMPGPFQAVYNASKSFLTSLGEALQDELADTGVTVTTVMPGPTDTDFFAKADMQDSRMGQGRKDDPAQVAQQGFDAMMAGKTKITAGSLRTKAMSLANSVTPDAVKSEAHRHLAEPGSAD